MVDLLAAAAPQDAAGLFHLAAFLPTAMPTATQQVFFHLLPSRASALCGKQIKLRRQVGDHLIDGDAAGHPGAQRLSLHGIGQANGTGGFAVWPCHSSCAAGLWRNEGPKLC